MSRRFYVEPPITDAVELDEALAGRLHRVMRLRSGDEITLFDGSGAEALTRIDQLDARSGRGTVIERCEGLPEPTTRVHLYQAIAKNDRFDWLVEKATEVGVARIVPLIAARSVVRTSESARRLERWRRIAIESAEQSGRSGIPVVDAPCAFADAIPGAPGVILLPYEQLKGDHDAFSVQRALDAEIDALFATGEVSLFIGPEGGFEPQEIELAEEYGASLVTLGPRVLRSETAGIVATTLVLHVTGELE